MADIPTEREYYENFRARLKAARLSLGWTQSQMATALGMEYESFKKCESRDRFPLHLIERLALVTQRPIEFWVTGRNVRQMVRRAG
jgi:transcriptional regulator with XRE-family HTH domain